MDFISQDINVICKLHYEMNSTEV